MDGIEPGDRVCLVGEDGTHHLVVVGEGHAEVDGLGVVDMDRLAGTPWGEPIKVGQRRVTPLPATPRDVMRDPERGAQIVTAKDAARIVLETGVGPGDRVLEIGSGSGVLTMALAHAVGPSGRVVSVDHRRDHVATADANLATAGLRDRVAFVEAKAEQLPLAGPFDGATLDIPNPEDALADVGEALAVGAGVAVYVPLVSQVEATRQALADGWVDARTLELVERPWKVGPRGSRPHHRVLGHTGFLTFARRARG